MIALLRRLPPLDRAAAAYAAVYVVSLSARALGFSVPVVLDVAFFPLGLMVGWADWRNSSVPGLDARTRLAWRLLAVAALVLWASGSVWAVRMTAAEESLVSNVVGRAAILPFVLAIAACFCFPGRPVPRGARRRFALDAAFMVAAGASITLYVIFTAYRQVSGGGTTFAIAEATIDWSLFVAAAAWATQKREPVARRVVVLLLTASLSSLIGNHVMAISPTYQNGDPVDGFWFAAWVCRWVAARYAWRAYTTSAALPSRHAPADDEYAGNPFAYVLVGGVFALLIAQTIEKKIELLWIPAVAAMAMGGLLIVRQFVELQENRRLVRARTEREARFTSLISNSSDVVLVVDGTGTVTYVSPAHQRVFGADARMAPGVRLQDLLTPEAASAVSTILAGNIDAPRHFQTRVQLVSGAWRDIEAVWQDLRHDPAVGGIVVNCRDATDRNEIERHLRHAQKLEAMGHLAGGLAHDLNNVLAVVRGYSELLQSEVGEGSPAAADLDQMMKAVDRASAVTQKVLAFSRKQPGRRTLVDMNDVLRDLRPMLGHLMKDQVEVWLDLQPGLWHVRADQGQLEQVLVNLATNARDAMPDGGVIRIATANRTVAGDPADPRSLPPGDYVSLEVKDEGLGMSPAVLAHIFEPFYTTKPQDRGLGLGLAIVHGIVTDLDGRVVVHSVEGEGSAFTIVVPRATAPAASA